MNTSFKQRVVISAPYFQPVVERFRAAFEERGIEIVVPVVHERLEESELLRIMPNIDGIICGDDRFTSRVLESCTKLKVISKWGTGIDSIDQDFCRKNGIAVCNTPNAFTVPVSDTVLAYALAFCRNVSSMDFAMKQGTWKKIPGFTLSEATVGIIGVGNIGSAVAKKFSVFGARLLGYDIKDISSELKKNTGLVSVSLDDLLRQSDIVSVNCDLNVSSKHLIREKTLALMKKNSFFINTARGPIVNEKDLCNALSERRIAGAALDVFEEEPLPEESPLRKMNNVFLAPHNSNSSPTAWEYVHQNTMNNLFRELAKHD